MSANPIHELGEDDYQILARLIGVHVDLIRPSQDDRSNDTRGEPCPRTPQE